MILRTARLISKFLGIYLTATQKRQGIVQQKRILKYKNPQKTQGQTKVDPLQQKYVEILLLTLTDYIQFFFQKKASIPVC